MYLAIPKSCVWKPRQSRNLLPRMTLASGLTSVWRNIKSDHCSRPVDPWQHHLGTAATLVESWTAGCPWKTRNARKTCQCHRCFTNTNWDTIDYCKPKSSNHLSQIEGKGHLPCMYNMQVETWWNGWRWPLLYCNFRYTGVGLAFCRLAKEEACLEHVASR